MKSKIKEFFQVYNWKKVSTFILVIVLVTGTVGLAINNNAYSQNKQTENSLVTPQIQAEKAKEESKQTGTPKQEEKTEQTTSAETPQQEMKQSDAPKQEQSGSQQTPAQAQTGGQQSQTQQPAVQTPKQQAPMQVQPAPQPSPQPKPAPTPVPQPVPQPTPQPQPVQPTPPKKKPYKCGTYEKKQDDGTTLIMTKWCDPE